MLKDVVKLKAEEDAKSSSSLICDLCTVQIGSAAVQRSVGVEPS